VDAWGLLKELREGWPAVRAARWVLFVALVAGTVTGFGIATLWWTGTVSTLRERLSFSQDKLQIALANPANPSALLTKEPGRHLSDQDRKCLVENFKDETSNFKAIMVSSFSEEEAQKYAAEFINLFLRMGYLSGRLDGRPSAYDQVGVMLGFKDIQNPSGPAKSFAAKMTKCNLITRQPVLFEGPPNLLPSLADVDFDLFIGPKDSP
jgi:hypothetical protein